MLGITQKIIWKIRGITDSGLYSNYAKAAILVHLVINVSGVKMSVSGRLWRVYKSDPSEG